MSTNAQNEYYVLFDYNQSEVPDSAMAFLVKKIYTENIKRVYLEGHCDSIGSRGYNYGLSQRRVAAVENLLVENGFDRKKISGKVGFGKDKPLTTNQDAAARQRNRRVLVKFVGGPMPKKIEKVEIASENLKQDTLVEFKTVRPIKTSSSHLMVNPKKVKVPSSTNKIVQQKKPAKKPKALKIENFKPNETIALPNLLFQGGRHFLINQSSASLDTLVRILKNKPLIRIEIQGHVCCTTYQDDGYDWDTRTHNLSENRANAIKAFLVMKGISSTRLRTKGFGGSQKLFPEEENQYQRQRNRRVEVMVLP